MSREGKKVCTTLNYIEHFLILASAITGCISISSFASLIGIPIEIASSETGLKICAKDAGIKKYTLESQIIGGVGIIGGLDIVIIINNRGGGEVGIIGGLDGVEKIV